MPITVVATLLTVPREKCLHHWIRSNPIGMTIRIAVSLRATADLPQQVSPRERAILAIQKLDDLLLVGTSGRRVTDNECLRLDMTRTGPSARFMGIINPYLATPWVVDSVADDSVVIEEDQSIARDWASGGSVAIWGGAIRANVGGTHRKYAGTDRQHRHECGGCDVPFSDCWD